ncbi:hypothetical protein [Sphingobacterium sp. MYb382]|uniref:hypothetical protein n=1 Tax=Sphingobacterium sp. MYb382 TaxID=2745278 RepID=UPI0030B1140A
MATKNLEDLDNEELLKEYKKRKGMYISNCVLVGMLIGTAVYSSINKGFGFFTFFPLFFIPLMAPTWHFYNKAKAEAKSRALI